MEEKVIIQGSRFLLNKVLPGKNNSQRQHIQGNRALFTRAKQNTLNIK